MKKFAILGVVCALVVPAVALGQQIHRSQGRIDGERPFYSADFELTAGRRYAAVTSELSSGCDPVIELRRSTDRNQAHDDDPIVAQDDDSGGNRNARIDWLCDRTAHYYVSVRAFATAGAGSFTLTVTDAGEVRQIHRSEGRIDGKSPFYSADFELSAGSTYVVTTSNLSTNCDTVIELRRSTDRNRAHPDDPIVAEDDDSGGNRASKITWECNRTSHYYVAVRAWSEAGAGSFVVTVLGTAGSREVYSDEGEIDGKSPVYSDDVEMVAGRTYVIATSDLSEGCDPMIQLQRSTDRERAHEDDPVMAEDDDGGGNRNARIVWTCDRTAHYYVKIWAFSEAAAGSFSITVTEQ